MSASVAIVPPPKHLRALRASAKTLDLSDKTEREQLRRRHTVWQADSYMYAKQVPEVGFAHNYAGNALSRVRLFIGAKIRPDEPPAQLDEELAKELDIPWDVVQAATNQLERLDVADGGIAQLQYRMGYCMSVAGEWYLFGSNVRADDTTAVDTDEDFEILSGSEIMVKGDNVYRKESPTDQHGQLIYSGGPNAGAQDNYIARVWRPDPEWSQQAFSSMVSLQNELEELLVIGRRMRAIERSAISAGFMLVPDSVGLTPSESPDEVLAAAAGNEPGVDGERSFESMFYETVTTPILDETSVGSVAPALVRGAAADLKEMRLLPIVRPLDAEVLARHDALLTRVANGIDLPSSVVLGTAGEANHWGAWLIDEDTFKAHIQPLVVMCHAGLWSAWIRPAIVDMPAATPEVLRKLTVWHDASQLVSHPNRFADVVQAYNLNEASGEAVRKYGGMTEEDRPDKIELRAKLVRDIAQHMRPTIGDPSQLPYAIAVLEALNEAEALDPGTVGEIAGQFKAPQEPGISDQGTGLPSPAQPPPAPAGPGTVAKGPPGTQPTNTQPAAAPAATPVRASAGRIEVRTTALAAMDRALMQRLLDKGDAAMTRAIERAGAKVRRPAVGNPQLAKRVDGVDNLNVIATLGPDGLRKAGFAVEELINDATFGTYRDQFNALVTRTQLQARRWVLSLQAEDRVLDALERDEYEERDNRDRDRGAEILIAGLVAAAWKLAFNPAPDAANTLGEFDSTNIAPTAAIRQALAVAGGDDNATITRAGAVVSGDGTPTDGVALGPTRMDALDQLGYTTDRWVWIHGQPERPFRPHEDLHGVPFTGDDDPVLANDGDWPDTDFFFAGDHDGCTCIREPILTRDDTSDDEETQ